MVETVGLSGAQHYWELLLGVVDIGLVPLLMCFVPQDVEKVKQRAWVQNWDLILEASGSQTYLEAH